jgi:hypothetical protein
MMTDGNGTMAAKTPRGVKIALAVSVALNLGVAGLVGGLALNGGPGGHGDRMVRDMGFGPFDAVFSPLDRGVLRKAIAGKMGDFRSMRRQVQGDLTTILTALRAEPYDQAAVAASFDALTQHMTDRVTLGSTVVRDYVTALPPEARLGFADRLEQVILHGPDRDGKPGGGN